MYEELASYRRIQESIRLNWPEFLRVRAEHLRAGERFGDPPEQVTENILRVLFSTVLDWKPGDLNHQVGRADLILSTFTIKRLVIEAKRPYLFNNWKPINSALDQAVRYATEQDVHRVAISDGVILYAADRIKGHARDRIFVRLDAEEAPESLCWLSVDGIYKERPDVRDAVIRLFSDQPVSESSTVPAANENDELLDRKHGLPARCFAYVPDRNDHRTWKLPYLTRDGSPDMRCLSMAAGCIVTNYRGVQLKGVEDNEVEDVLVRLGKAAWRAGKMPGQIAKPAPTYAQLHDALLQLGRLDEIKV